MSDKTPEQALAEAHEAYVLAKADLDRASDAYDAVAKVCDAVYTEYVRVREAYIRDRKPAAQGGE